MLNWHLLYTKPKNEDSLAKRFGDGGFEVLNPKIKERRYYRRKLQDIVSPLFPCYMFVKFDFPENYRLVKYTRGVKKVVGTENTPYIVPQEMIDVIILRMEEGVVSVDPTGFAPGEDVLIKDGPFKDFEAVFESHIKGMDRVSILIKAINAKAIIDGHMLSKR